MNVVVTAGPTYESLDEVRRLTNFSTGRLGTALANHLVACGHHVTLLRGYYTTAPWEARAQVVQTFTTTSDLRDRLQRLSRPTVAALFHAAAVSDFGFGKVWERTPAGELVELSGGKFSTRQGTLLAELVPTPKILRELRDWYPTAHLVGWKYEVDGGRNEVIAKAAAQLAECRTDACVANGRAYGPGFGIVTPDGQCREAADDQALFTALESLGVRPA